MNDTVKLMCGLLCHRRATLHGATVEKIIAGLVDEKRMVLI